jgi:catechol-2,3-dioxygenase
LDAYTRLKKMRIEPVIPVDHGPTTSFYYEDPDRNSVELFVDNFSTGNSQQILCGHPRNFRQIRLAP